MSRLLTRLLGPASPVARSGLPLTIDEYLSWFTYGGIAYGLAGQQTLPGAKQEEIGGNFSGLVSGAYYSNGPVFACCLARLLLFSECRFQFRQLRSGRPGNLFGGRELTPLEQPWPGGTTGDLLARAILDADLAGNNFTALRPGGRLKRLRPDWVTIILGSQLNRDAAPWDPDAEVLGYVYQPAGPGSDPVFFRREEVAHFAPIPDPLAQYRGMSWLNPIVREVMGDRAATDHKLTFFENGATPNMVVKVDPTIRNPQTFKQWVDLFKAEHEGRGNEYKTVFLGGGSDATVVGSNLQQLDFKVTQGAGETRIASAARVPPVIVGFSEGLQGSSLNQGNYDSALRQFIDLTMRPLWRNYAGSMATLIDAPPGSELWYDDRDVPALRENIKDAAEARETDARTLKTLVDAGYDPASAQAAVLAGDFALLKHSGLVSVQLLPPGSQNGGEPKPAAESVAE